MRFPSGWTRPAGWLGAAARTLQLQLLANRGAPNAPPEGGPTLTPALEAEPEGACPGTATVLVVDDDDASREGVAAVLASYGYAVRTARDGIEALRALDQRPLPSLILLDLTMPKLDGWGFRAQQLLDPNLRDVPVVLLSGIDDLRREAGRLQVAACLEKPIDVDKLIQLVDSRCA